MRHLSTVSILMGIAGLLAALAAAGTTAWVGKGASGGRRRAWLWLAAACLGWATSQVWRLAGGPQVTDGPAGLAGMLGIALVPLLALAGLIAYSVLPASESTRRTWLVLDATTVTLALWAAACHLPVVESWEVQFDSPTVLVATVPALTNALLVAAVFICFLYRGCRRSPTVTWLLVGLAVVAGVESSRWFARASHSTLNRPVVDLLWILGILAILAAVRRVFADGPAAAEQVYSPREALWRVVFPYGVVLAAALSIVGQWFYGIPVAPAPAVLVAGLGILAPIRQYAALDGNPQLLSHLHRFHRRRRRSGQRDALTGLPNRGALKSLLADAMARSGRGPLAVVSIRPNRRQLLDELDSDQADAIVVELAARIGARLGPGDRLARIGDVTFAVLVRGGKDTALDLVREVMVAAEAPMWVGNLGVHPFLAAGIVAVPLPDEPDPAPAALIQYAGIALRTVSSVRGGIALFTRDMLHRHDALSGLREAVGRTVRHSPAAVIAVRFELIVELATGKVVGVAARAEWQDEGHEALPARQLASLAQDAGVAEQLHELLVGVALRRFADWRRQWPELCQRLWITVSAETFASPGPDFTSRLASLLSETGVPANALVVDPLDGRPYNSATQTGLRLLHEYGVLVASADALVLAESSAPGGRRGPRSDELCQADFYDVSPILVERCVDDVRARRLVQATAEFAGTQNAGTAARQVTSIAQHEQLRDLGVSLGRGQFYGTGLSADEIERLLAAVAAGEWQTPVGRETRRRRSSQAWQELRQVINGLPIGAFACDFQGELVMAEGGLFGRQDIFPDRLDVSLASLIGSASGSGGHHSLAGPLRLAMRGKPSVSTIPVRDRWLQVHLCARRNPDRVITGALGVAIDVTHRVQAENALRSSDRRFREVFDQAPVGMIVIGPDNRLTDLNPAMASMLGYRPAELIGREITSLWHPDTAAEACQQFESLRSGTLTRYHAERAFRHRDGSQAWVRVTGGMLAESDVPGTVIAIAEDLQHVKQLEVELRHSQKLEAVGMLAAGIAHEINTPIQFISDNTSFLSEAYQQVTTVLTKATELAPAAGEAAVRELEQLTEEMDLEWVLEQIPRATSQSLEGVAQVANIVRAMRNFGHPDQRERSLFDINAAVRDTAIIAHNEMKHVADLHLDLDEVPAILGYPSELNQVILNLFVNATHAIVDADHGPGRRGNVWVRTWSDSQAVFLSVVDDGCGMTEETRNRIFEPFFTTKEVGRGTGQGLTIVYNVVVDKHQGTVSVDSAPGVGTTFTVRLPLPDLND